eukprot:1772475-Pyramimonas_sp.AAC.1
MALAWTVWLVCGPSIRSMEAFFNDVRSFTADFGVESGLADVANVLDDFACKVGQRCSPSWQTFDYMFPHCVFIVDWDHLLDAILRNTLKDVEVWPKILGQLQTLCAFFNNDDYLLTCRLDARRRGLRECEQALSNWNATFAKWRYRTVRVVIAQAVKVSEYCQSYFDIRIMGSIKDASALHDVGTICKDAFFFWEWIRSFEHIVVFIDRIREWGSGCACHEQERIDRKKVACFKAGRRLHEARGFLATMTQMMSTMGNTLAVDTDCYGNAETVVG